MSRHTISAIDPKHQVVVGWDAPMGTFFGQVFDTTREDDEDDLLFQIGQKFNQLPALDGLLDAMLPYAIIPTDVVQKLVYDREREGDRSQVGRDRVQRVTGIQPL